MWQLKLFFRLWNFRLSMGKIKGIFPLEIGYYLTTPEMPKTTLTVSISYT